MAVVAIGVTTLGQGQARALVATVSVSSPTVSTHGPFGSITYSVTLQCAAACTGQVVTIPIPAGTHFTGSAIMFTTMPTSGADPSNPHYDYTTVPGAVRFPLQDRGPGAFSFEFTVGVDVNTLPTYSAAGPVQPTIVQQGLSVASNSPTITQNGSVTTPEKQYYGGFLSKSEDVETATGNRVIDYTLSTRASGADGQQQGNGFGLFESIPTGASLTNVGTGDASGSWYCNGQPHTSTSPPITGPANCLYVVPAGPMYSRLTTLQIAYPSGIAFPDGASSANCASLLAPQQGAPTDWVTQMVTKSANSVVKETDMRAFPWLIQLSNQPNYGSSISETSCVTGPKFTPPGVPGTDSKKSASWVGSAANHSLQTVLLSASFGGGTAQDTLSIIHN